MAGTESFPKFKSKVIYCLEIADGGENELSYFGDKESLVAFLKATSRSQTFQVYMNDSDEHPEEISVEELKANVQGMVEDRIYYYTIEQLYTLR